MIAVTRSTKVDTRKVNKEPDNLKNWIGLSGNAAGESWLSPFMQSQRHHLTMLPRLQKQSDWHQRRKSTSQLKDWICHLRHSKAALNLRPDGIVTTFPQLAVTTGALLRLKRKAIPLLAWCFNIGTLPHGIKRRAACYVLSRVDKFVVHSSSEITTCANWLNLPEERFKFVPLQRGDLHIDFAEDLENPFVVAVGSAKRDYETFLDVMRELPYRGLIITAPRIASQLSCPPNVEIIPGLPHQECRRLIQQARIVVTPIDNDETASGQVTVIEAMWFARPTISTNTIGTVDYVNNGEDGILVPPRDSLSLRDAIVELWDDEQTRQRLGTNARERAKKDFSDQAAARALVETMDELA